MLVLSRKTGEGVIIAGNVRVVVLGVQGDRVKLGFEGPAHVPIHREEVLERIVQEEAVSESTGHKTISSSFYVRPPISADTPGSIV